MDFHSQHLIIGTGLAGLYYALEVAKKESVIIINKSKMQNCNSTWAQGGIAAVMSESDSFEKHIQDTLAAGANLNDTEVVKQVVENAPDAISHLTKWGVKFDRDSQNQLHLAKEGAHSERRVLHVQDHTGKDIHEKLLQKAVEHPNIQIFEEACAVDLLTSKKLHLKPNEQNRCFGAYILDVKTSKVFTVGANFTILATGGAGKIYLYTSNWDGATGDGIAIAHRAGARIANMEFMQFHPTCLYHHHAANFLITEALRGEGAVLVNEKGSAFMDEKHPLGSLAPRDIVARGIDEELKRTGADCAYLELKNKDEDFLLAHFPSIFEKCLQLGIDIRKEPIPVVPAAHYLCGGVLTDKDAMTDIAGLSAIGEVACTGLHGANRLASNSLLECCVFAQKAAHKNLSRSADFKLPENLKVPAWKDHSKTDKDEMIVISHTWDEVRRLMWNYVGIVRSNKRLDRAQQRLEAIISEVGEYYWDFKMHRDILELRNLTTTALLSVKCARKRKESRGIHYNIDYPEISEDEAYSTIIS
ncbi:MAG: L-aspartate oxidase [Bdellovibrionaceae bacterium]|nr:L-aspartate oxidase [Pseudobdellovibrionaceae bacterium]|tara:strand:- start:30984 stop:32573 length:1590 start_codon:yes stop_codon:yes gene_type:complete